MLGLPPDSMSEQHEDVLQNIEVVVTMFYRQHPELSDHNVNKIYEGLERTYKATSAGKTPLTLRFTPLEQSLFDAVKAVCEWRMGQGEDPNLKVGGAGLDPIDISVIIACLKRLQKSIRLWTTEFGMRGYLNYVEQFIP